MKISEKLKIELKKYAEKRNIIVWELRLFPHDYENVAKLVESGKITFIGAVELLNKIAQSELVADATGDYLAMAAECGLLRC